MAQKIINVSAGIIIKDDQVLICQRREAHHKGAWEFPGGKIELNESHQEALKRELNEDDYREMILNMQGQLIDSKASPNLLLKLYKKEENWAGIILYLDKLNDFDLIKEYDSILYKYERKALTELYIYMIQHYLDTYIGDFADNELM